jgi:hypothetical protein
MEDFLGRSFSIGRWIHTDGFARVVKKPEGTQGFVLLPKGWTVERTYG